MAVAWSQRQDEEMDDSGRASTWAEVRALWGAEIERRIHESASAPGLLGEMLAHHLRSGGKRVRALLPVWVARNLGGRAEDALDLGAGLELLHNATLLHDDVQDGDGMRRDAPTVWARWGSAQAINAGDGLVFLALARMGRAPSGARAVAAVCRQIVRVVEGQTLELQLRTPPGDPSHVAPSLAAWKHIAVRKTGALFTACIQSGMIAAGAGEPLLESAARYGDLLGLLFQAQDDLLDLVGDKGRRQRGSDLFEGKASLPVVWAYEHAPDQAEELRAIVQLRREHKTRGHVAAAMELLARSGAIDAASRWIEELYQSAAEHPVARLCPGLAARIVAPLAGALSVPGDPL